MIKKIISVIITGLFVGTLVALLVQFFLNSADFLTTHFRKNYDDINFEDDYSYFTFFIYFFAIPVFIGVLVGIIRNLNKDKRWHGPPDVILSVHQDSKELNIKSGFLTTIASILSISVGSSVGQYGPLVHFGGTIGAEIKKLFSFAPDFKILVSAGVASAISSGFGAPLAGLIFAREVILRHQSLASFAPILVASVVSYLFTKNIFGMDPIFEGSVGEINSLYDFPFFIIAGIVCGFVSIIYMNGLTHSKYFPNISFINPVLQPAIAGLICGIMSIFLPEVIGLGTGAIQSMILGNVEFIYAIYFLIFKLLLTIICLRMGLIGGVFAPALFLGASVGVILGFIFQNLSPTLDLNLLTVASMSAFASCVIGGPVANMMIILELTSDYQATLVAGVSIVFASLISYKVIGQSVFDKVLLNKNIDLKVGRENIKLQQIPVSEISHKDYCSLQPNFTVEQSINTMIKSKKSESYLVDDNEKLLNKFELHQLLGEKNKKKKILQLHTSKFLKLYSETNIFESIEQSKDFVGESIPIVSKQNKIYGVISEGDLFQIFLKITKEEKELENKD